MTTTEQLTARCCIAGGGPAGMMLGFLLARAGIDVVVLEKHADFLRDFRGDTIHPSTLELMHELGLLAEFLKRPHTEVNHLTGMIGDTVVHVADFTHLPTHCRFVALMPQWDFLNFIAEQGAQYSGFRLLMRAEATDLIEEGGRVVGVRAKGPDGSIDIRADLVVGADGRHSTIRERAGFQVDDLGAPMDVLWMRLSKRPDDSSQALGHIEAGRIFVMLDRGDYWQCAFVIPKGGYDGIRQKGFEAFLGLVAAMARLPADRVAELRDWDDVKLLTVAVDRLRQWYRPGLLCIGDAAHAMSPIGGVGINLAIQDAVAAANILAAPLASGPVALDDLRAVQSRRTFPTRATQWLQVAIQNRIISRVMAATARPVVPWAIKLLSKCPFLQRIPARLVGMGFRPEHVRTPAVAKRR
jgi:2-polyprenyl-6-methoxyphenol hydroxylase-like FAD-dependent oxidoreductase